MVDISFCDTVSAFAANRRRMGRGYGTTRLDREGRCSKDRDTHHRPSMGGQDEEAASPIHVV